MAHIIRTSNRTTSIAAGSESRSIWACLAASSLSLCTSAEPEASGVETVVLASLFEFTLNVSDAETAEQEQRTIEIANKHKMPSFIKTITLVQGSRRRPYPQEDLCLCLCWCFKKCRNVCFLFTFHHLLIQAARGYLVDSRAQPPLTQKRNIQRWPVRRN